MQVNEQAVEAAIEAIAYKAYDTRRDAVIACLTAAAPYMSGAKVKPLDWVHYDAETQFGKYSIQIDDDEELHDSPYCTWSPDGKLGHFDSKELAKAAAQADYEKRIMPALEPSPAREQALEEAAQICDLSAKSSEDRQSKEQNPFIRNALMGEAATATALAKRIRVLKSQPPQTGGGE